MICLGQRAAPMSPGQLHAEFIRRLVAANDETKTAVEHARLVWELRAWEQGVKAACGRDFIFEGDWYYLAMIDAGEMKDRPMCCGVFLDWGESHGAEQEG